jgi:hypothetical protein
LPKAGEPPFVAALPQAALANPAGPLGVIGHVDLAWTWSFLDSDASSALPHARSRTERFQGILRALVDGHRLGVAHHELARFFRSVSTELSTLYDDDARLGTAVDSDVEDEARRARRAGLWMQRHDLSAYVLLGDPAARLPIARFPAGVQLSATTPPSLRFAARDLSRMEEAVLATLRGTEAPGAIAARQLASWLESNGEDAAAASLREGLDETLTVIRLGLPTTLSRTFATTNAIENMNGTLRRVIRNVKRWRGESMILRWVALGIDESQRGFRRVKGHGQMSTLLAALRPKKDLDEVTKAA